MFSRSPAASTLASLGQALRGSGVESNEDFTSCLDWREVDASLFCFVETFLQADCFRCPKRPTRGCIACAAARMAAAAQKGGRSDVSIYRGLQDRHTAN